PVVEGERPLPAEAIADPAREHRAHDVHCAHEAEGLGGVHLGETVLRRVRNEVREDETVGRIPTHEERYGEEPERGYAQGLGDGDAPLVSGTAEGLARRSALAVRLEPHVPGV